MTKSQNDTKNGCIRSYLRIRKLKVDIKPPPLSDKTL